MIDGVFLPIQWKVDHQCFPAVNDAQRVNERQDTWEVVLYDKKGVVYSVCGSKVVGSG